MTINLHIFETIDGTLHGQFSKAGISTIMSSVPLTAMYQQLTRRC